MELININKVIDDNKNYKNDVERTEILKYSKLKQSILTFEQREPIVVDKDYNIVHGRNILRVCKELGFQMVWVSIFKRHRKDELTEFYMAKNLLTQLYDPVEMLSHLKQCKASDLSGGNNLCVPFTEPEIDMMVKMLDFDWSLYKKQRKENVIF